MATWQHAVKRPVAFQRPPRLPSRARFLPFLPDECDAAALAAGAEGRAEPDAAALADAQGRDREGRRGWPSGLVAGTSTKNADEGDGSRGHILQKAIEESAKALRVEIEKREKAQQEKEMGEAIVITIYQSMIELPVKRDAAQHLIEGFVKDEIMSPVQSEWGFPGVLAPKPGNGPPYRLFIDLRKLNEICPKDTYEPPSCGGCLLPGWRTGLSHHYGCEMGFSSIKLE